MGVLGSSRLSRINGFTGNNSIIIPWDSHGTPKFRNSDFLLKALSGHIRTHPRYTVMVVSRYENWFDLLAQIPSLPSKRIPPKIVIHPVV